MKSRFTARRGWLAPAAGLGILTLAGVGLVRNTAHSGLPSSEPERLQVRRTLPLRFEPNLGQMDSSVSFVARGAGFQVLVKPAEAVLALDSAPSRLRSEAPSPGSKTLPHRPPARKTGRPAFSPGASPARRRQHGAPCAR